MFGTNMFESAVAKIAEPGGVIGIRINKKGKLYFCFPGVHMLSQLGQQIINQFDEHLFIELDDIYMYPVQ